MTILSNYADEPGMNYMERHERVIEFVRCDINDFIVENDYKAVDDSDQDRNWV